MRKCDVCGTKIPFNATHCPNCGTQYKTSNTGKALPKKKRQIDWKLVFRVLSRVLIAVIVVYNVYSRLQKSQITPKDYFANQYGENYVLKEYKDFETFQKEYPELSEQLQPYYQLVKQRQTDNKNPESVYPTLNQELITIVNDTIHSVTFNTFIYNELKDIGVNYNLDRIQDTVWNEMVSVDCYNVKKEEFTDVVKSYLYYIEDILDIEMEDKIVEISEKIDNYYKAVIYVEYIDEYQLSFNYNANGDFVINLHRTIHDEGEGEV